MKMRWSILIWAISALSIISAAQRLPRLAVPENYKLTWSPDFSSDSFAGEETIHIQVLKPTTEIVLDAVDIDFQQTSITSNGETQQTKVVPDAEKEIVSLAVPKELSTGPATIQIKYTGRLNNQLRGFYLGHDEQGNKYAVTQFEATDARRAFPSFDEPVYKATFDLRVIADKDLAVISNSPVASDTPDPASDKHTVQFATTPKMSSYLLAVAVGHFEFVEGASDDIPIRVWTTPGKKQLASFALETAENVLHYYDHYFGIKYPYKKLDLIALPDFSAGAMENTACITFRQVLLLLNDQRASLDSRKEVASVIAHEMAHQWFGDLVTMKWWDDIWLNEGFATWMSSKPLKAWHPEWHFELNDVMETAQSLNVDSLENTRPIHQAAETPDQILELFDGIAYGKTAAVLRMLESYLGPEAFQKGVNAYLKEHAYGNSTAADFWSALAKASGKPVDKIMPTFVEQAGVPLVHIQAECAHGSDVVDLTQRRYFYNRDLFNSEDNHEVWMVPTCMKTADASQPKCELLTKKEEKITLKGCSPWTYGNRDALGYYRSGYTPADLRAIAKSVETALTPAERIMLLTDAWSSMRVGQITIGDYLALPNGFRSEHNNAVVEQLGNELNYVSDYLVSDSDRPAFNTLVRNLFAHTAEEIGWKPKPGESEDQEELRASLLLVLGRTGQDPEAQEQAKKIVEKEFDNPGSVSRELMAPALVVAAIHGDAALYDQIMTHLEQSQDPEQRAMYSQILADFTDPTLVEKTLEYFISSKVRSQDTPLLLARSMRNPATQKQAWDFIQSHWQQIENQGGPFSSGRFARAGESFCSAVMRDSLTDFFSTHENSAQRTLKQSVEQINDCVDLKSQQTSALNFWLEKNAPLQMNGSR
jgi:aminopeptidase N